MKKNQHYIILSGVFISCLSSIYFFTLLLHLPFVVAAALVIALFYFLHKWLTAGSKDAAGPITKADWFSLVLLVVSLGIMCANLIKVAPKYGGWDAMAIWNFHAEYLTYPDHWRKLFQNIAYSHADYPLCQPAIIAFFMRLLSTDSTLMVPFVLAMILTLAIPVLIYQELARKQIIVAVGMLLIFLFERYYLEAGASQYADMLVAFFFLCAFVCVRYIGEDRRYVSLAVFFAASCAWTKNEGFVLAAIFLAGYGAVFFSRENIRYTLLGIAIPLMSLVLFKLTCHVQNDLVAGVGGNTLRHLLERERYAAIFHSYVSVISKNYRFTAAAIVLFAIICAVRKQAPGKSFFILFFCLVAYSIVYVLTPKNLAWHLSTSHARLLVQLMPALLYVIGDRLADMPFSLPRMAKTK